ncbi:hypothetical protein ES703_71866 [subsurface metagenome]
MFDNEVRKLDIIRRATERLDLRDVHGKLRLLSLIVPTMDTGELLKSVNFQVSPTVDPGAAGMIVVFTIPVKKLWWVRVIRAHRVAGAALTIRELTVRDLGVAELAMATWAASQDHTEILPNVFPVREGWQIRANIAAYGAGDTFNVELVVEEEDAY